MSARDSMSAIYDQASPKSDWEKDQCAVAVAALARKQKPGDVDMNSIHPLCWELSILILFGFSSWISSDGVLIDDGDR